MNALIKAILTSIIGFIGPLETSADRHAKADVNLKPVLEILYIDPDAKIFCRFEELSCKKLNKDISS